MKISPKIAGWMALVMGVELAAAALFFVAQPAQGQSTSSPAVPQAQAKNSAMPEPVILDTDIGDDIDDAFALGLALKSPEVKLLGITTTYGDTELRAKLLDRYLSAVRTDIPVSIGIPTPHTNVFTQAVYAQPGKLPGADPCFLHMLSGSQLPMSRSEKDRYDACEKDRHDAVGSILRNAKERPGQVTLIGIGPLFNVQAAIEKDPATFKKLKRVVIMVGSIDRGYDSATDNKRPPDAEWNIKCDPAGLRALLASGVPVYMMPLDSTQVRLSQHDLEKILANGTPVTDQLALLYHQWVWGNDVRWTTPTLFDPIAVAYSIRPELCPTTPMRIEVDDKGFTRRVDGPPNAQVCLKSDENGFRQLLLDRLTVDSGR
jgi:inosine-uridine nucleoside N-ribohydrolase